MHLRKIYMNLKQMSLQYFHKESIVRDKIFFENFGGNMIDKELLNILACPACKGDVKLEGEKIVCAVCGRRYPIKDGIPIMLVDEAEKP